MPATYTCPTCNATMQRDMLLLYKHTDEHIVDALKEQNPRWITNDGYCPKCLDFYKKQMGRAGLFSFKKTTNASLVNIGVGGAKRRTVIGIISFAAAAILLYQFKARGMSAVWNLVLFFPFFLSMLGLIQAREQICVILGVRGTRDMDTKEEKVSSEGLAKELKKASNQILVLCAAIASSLTALTFFL